MVYLEQKNVRFSCLSRFTDSNGTAQHSTDFQSTFQSPLTSFPTMSRSHSNECRIYVGNLPPDIRTKDIEDLFYKFGKITFIDLKNRRGPPFSFIEFEDPRYVLMLDF